METINFKYAAAIGGIAAVFYLAYYFSSQAVVPSAANSIPWKSFDDGIVLAQQSNKKLLVDVYTDWCTWCKKMDAEVYTNPEVLKLINTHFVAVKLNAESNNTVTYKGKSFNEADFARQLGVNGYPTTIFFDQQQNPITEYSGYAPPETFAKVLGFIGDDRYKSSSFQDFLSNSASRP